MTDVKVVAEAAAEGKRKPPSPPYNWSQSQPQPQPESKPIASATETNSEHLDFQQTHETALAKHLKAGKLYPIHQAVIPPL